MCRHGAFWRETILFKLRLQLLQGFIKNYARQYRRFRERQDMAPTHQQKKVGNKPEIFHWQMWIYPPLPKRKWQGQNASQGEHRTCQFFPSLSLVFLTVSDTVKYIILKSFSVFMLTVTVADIWVLWFVEKFGVLEIWWTKQPMGFWLNPESFFFGRQITFLFLNGLFANKVDSQNHGARTHTLQCPTALRGGPKREQ